MGSEACLCAEEIHAVCVSAVPSHSIPITHSGCSTSTAFWWIHDVWEWRETQNLLLILSKPGTDSPRGHAFQSNQNLLRMQKDGSGGVRNTND